MVIGRESQEARAIRVLVWVSMALVLADVVVYIVLIRGQGQGDARPFTAPFVAGYMVVMAVFLWLSLLDLPWVALRLVLRGGAAAGLLVLGVFAVFSIGLPIFVAGVLAAIAAITALARTRLRYGVLWEIGAALIALTVLVVGFEVTQRAIQCPPNGTMSGSSSGFIAGGYHYECVNGTLNFHSGACNGTQAADANGNATSSPC
jgi:hypothetical protein